MPFIGVALYIMSPLAMQHVTHRCAVAPRALSAGLILHRWCGQAPAAHTAVVGAARHAPDVKPIALPTMGSLTSITSLQSAAQLGAKLGATHAAAHAHAAAAPPPAAAAATTVAAAAAPAPHVTAASPAEGPRSAETLSPPLPPAPSSSAPLPFPGGPTMG